MIIVKNEKDELILKQTVTGWRMCIEYRKLNNATRKDHFPLMFIDQMLERLAGHEYYFLLDGFSGYFHIPIALEDQEKTTFTCANDTITYKRMPFELCNTPATFQRCMTVFFHELVEDSMEVFMDDFFVFGSSFDHYLKNLEKMLKSGPSGGHHGIITIARKVFEAGFYWLNIFRDASRLHGTFPSSNGNKYILVAIDYVSK
nr:RNA-directed DNA polymerase homolog [Tanacetum cinerariifolium]